MSATASESECVYRVARDFRNIQAEKYIANVSSGDATALLLETGDSLVRRNEQSNTIVPGLARSWEFDESSQSFIFTLNQSCRWSDGSALRADDFVYGFRELYNYGEAPNVGGYLIAGAESIIEKGAPLSTLQVKALGDDKVRVGITGAPDVALMYLSYGAYTPLPSHISKAEHIPLTSPVRLSIGPYSVESVEADLIVLHKNPYYCSDQKVSVDRIDVFNRKPGYWESSEVMAGRLDMMRYTSEKPLQVVQKATAENSKVRLEIVAEARQTYLVLNPLYSGLANKEIRSKLFAAIDYLSLVNRGNSTSNVRRIAKTLFYDLPNYENYRYTRFPHSYKMGIDALRTTMEKYGYSNINRLRMNILTYPLERFETSARMLVSMLKQAHFDIKYVKSLSVAEVIEDAQAGRFDMFFDSWTLDYADPQSSLDGLFQIVGYLLEQDDNVELKESFIDPLKEQLLRLEQSRNQADRFKNLQIIEKLLLESSVIIPLYTEHSAILVSSRMKALKGQFPHSWLVKFNDCDDMLN